MYLLFGVILIVGLSDDMKLPEFSKKEKVLVNVVNIISIFSVQGKYIKTQ